MELTGAQILLETLKREGVTTYFGYPGGAVIDVYHAMAESPLEHILVRHEQAAVHAADGYARASGKVGVCLVTSGPGATNAVTGIATAYSDSIPLVIITGQVSTPLIGNDAFQEVDIIGITRPCTKHNFLVRDVTKLATIIRQAFYLARSGRPGPVLIDFPKDIMQAKCEYIWPSHIHMRSYNPTYKPNLSQIEKAAELIAESKHPLILAGGGVISSNASEVLTKLANTYQIPVVGTLMGLGSFPQSSSLWAGMVGMHGSVAANLAVTNSDLLIAVGTRFADRVTGKLSEFAKKAKIIHIDIDPTSIRKNVHVNVPIVGDCKESLIALDKSLSDSYSGTDWGVKHKDWISTIVKDCTQKPLNYIEDGSLKPQKVIEVAYEITKGDAIITTEVGQSQMWAAQFYKFEHPRTFITSGGLGTMGYGLPAAMGIQFAVPNKIVINMAGDGSIQMNIQELATVVENRLPIKILILNNCNLGMVRQWQELFYDKNYMHTCMVGQPDFVKLAEAYGAEGYRINTEQELVPVLTKALLSPNPAVIDARVTKEENVYPMVPSGATLDEMLLV